MAPHGWMVRFKGLSCREYKRSGMNDVRRVAIALVLVGALALAGCTLGSNGSGYPDDSEVRDRLTSIETVEADVVVETDDPNGTTERMHLVRNFSTGDYRATVTAGPANGTTLVIDGSQAWYYLPQQNVARETDDPIEGSALNATIDTVTTIFDHLDDGEDADGSVGISPAPTVPTTGQSSPSKRELSLPLGDSATVTDAGTATVDGRETRVVDVDVTDDSSIIENATYWIGDERHFPLKAAVTVRTGGQTTVATTTYRNVTFNEPVSEERFTLDASPDAQVVESPNGTLRSYSNRTSLATATDLEVPDPSLPDEYELQSAQITPRGTNETITMIYGGEGTTITVRKLLDFEAEFGSDGERIEVGDRPGRFLDLDGSNVVVWTCTGDTYSVQGPADGPSLRDVASSMACE